MAYKISRRGMLEGALIGAGALAVPAALAGCGSSDSNGSDSKSGTVNKSVAFGSNYSDEVPKKAIADVLAKFDSSKGFTTKNQYGRPQLVSGEHHPIPAGQP